MRPGDRLRVSAAYGERYPAYAYYVGALGTAVAGCDGSEWVQARLDRDGGSLGLFQADEVEPYWTPLRDPAEVLRFAEFAPLHHWQRFVSWFELSPDPEDFNIDAPRWDWPER